MSICKSTRKYDQFRLINSYLPIIEKYDAHITINNFGNLIIVFSSKYTMKDKTYFNFILFELQNDKYIKVAVLYGTEFKNMKRIPEYMVQPIFGKINIEKLLFKAIDIEKEYIEENDPEYLNIFMALTRRFFLIRFGIINK